MKDNECKDPTPDRDQTARTKPVTRLPYAPPRLEPLGAWSALTLQQSIPIGPGNW